MIGPNQSVTRHVPCGHGSILTRSREEEDEGLGCSVRTKGNAGSEILKDTTLKMGPSVLMLPLPVDQNEWLTAGYRSARIGEGER